MYTIQRLTTCSTRVRKTKNSIEQRGKASCDTLTRFENLQKKRVHHSLWSAIHRSLGSADARRSLGSVEVWDGVGWGGVGWCGVGCYRSLPVANTVDRTVKVWDGVAVRGNNWVYVTLGFGVTKFRSNLIFNYWRNPISRNTLILNILNIFKILNKSNIYIYIHIQ